MERLLGGKRPVSEINVTPLVDVVLVLLIIFMVLTPLAEKQMFMRVPEYQPPESLEPPAASPSDQLVLTVKADGRLLLNGREVEAGEAMTDLQAAYQGRPSKVLFLDAEDQAKYDSVVHVADLARRAGVNTIGLMTETLSPEGDLRPAHDP